ncbi:Up-regulator of cell proliferation like [Heracleum sosnowskyi]|uniref:Up-regulator of cell proliferation like n=1 Tax=Heracleum sosnowskyi TaxID=360622 RepID=A0AAD8M5V2_9APIA|nr:Up-regulator of cell proliferation like [Heracleum sosnowskyi]
MLGRMRLSSWSSLEELEMERSASIKHIKDDSLSIYETTLMKLKEGSRRNTNLENLDSTGIGIDNAEVKLAPVVEEVEMLDTDCTSSVTSTNQSDCQPIEKEQQNKSVSIVSLFARYKNAHCALGSPDQKAVVVENGCMSSDTSEISNHVN